MNTVALICTPWGGLLPEEDEAHVPPHIIAAHLLSTYLNPEHMFDVSVGKTSSPEHHGSKAYLE